MMFKRAEKRKSKLRLAIYGPSGGGKTLSSLLIATGIGGRVAVIDTEHGRASIYADKADFDVMELHNGQRTINNYINAMKAAAQAGYDVLVIDSLSHAWKELLEEMDRVAAKKYRGNSFAAWREGTPEQNRLIDMIVSYPGHIIATMRTKTEYVVEQNSKGKSSPRKIGLAPEQGKGIEYEFNLLLNINQSHYVVIEKDNTGGDFQDMEIDKPGVEFGRQLMEFLSADRPVVQQPAPVNKPAPPPPAKPPVDKKVQAIAGLLRDLNYTTKADMHKALEDHLGICTDNMYLMTDEQKDRVNKYFYDMLHQPAPDADADF